MAGLAILWILETGCRHEEACRFRWERINTETSAWNKVGVKARGGHKNRYHALSDEALAILHRRRQQIEGEPTGYVFPAYASQPETKRNSFLNIWTEHVRPKLHKVYHDMTIHELRHTYGVHRRKDGRSLEWIQAQLGHDDIASTQIYARPAEAILNVINDSEPAAAKRAA